MNMEILEVTDKMIWENYLQQWPEANFLQSWNWGQFHLSLAKRVYYLHILKNGQIIGSALVVSEKAKRGNYLTIAGGPLLDWKSKQISVVITALLAKLRVIAQKEKAVFLRLRLQELESDELHQCLQSNGFVLSPMHLTADLTLQLDITQSEDAILAGMRKNTRYEVKKAERLGIQVQLSKDASEIKTFYDHQLKVASRQDFVPFSYDFLHKQFQAFSNDNQVLLFHSFFEGKLLASAFIIFYGNEAVYHYGISTDDNAKLPGSYACQWAAIREAKKRGLTRYNFWGVAPEDQPDHRFAGVGLFKRGFGGHEVHYLPAYDYAFQWQYSVVREFELIRKKMRKL